MHVVVRHGFVKNVALLTHVREGASLRVGPLDYCLGQVVVFVLLRRGHLLSLIFRFSMSVEACIFVVSCHRAIEWVVKLGLLGRVTDQRLRVLEVVVA